MNTPVLSPLCRAAIGYANIVASLPHAELLGGLGDDWRELRSKHLGGPHERIRVVLAALDLCQAARKYNSIDEFSRALGTLLRAAGMAYDAPEGKVWRRRDEHSAWYLADEGEPITETPDVWSPRRLDGNFVFRPVAGVTINSPTRRLDTGNFVVPAVVGMTFNSTMDADLTADTLRYCCMFGHGGKIYRYGECLDAVTAW